VLCLLNNTYIIIVHKLSYARYEDQECTKKKHKRAHMKCDPGRHILVIR
jgi:hypothetical protein